jgi:TolA-binding protein
MLAAVACLAALSLAGCAMAKRANYDQATAANYRSSLDRAGRTNSPSAPAAPSPARREFEAAWAMLDQGQYAKAEGAFTQWLGAHGDDALAPEAMFFQAYAREKLGRADARQTYQRLIDRYVDSPSAAAARRRLGQ